MKWLLVSIMVVATVAGEVLQSREMKREGGYERLLQAIVRRRWLIVSILCNAASFFAFMALLQRAPLSFAVPASAASYVLETLMAKFVLHEKVGLRRAAGAVIVLAGVVLVGG